VYGTDYLPHDGRNMQLGTGMSIQEQLIRLGRRVQITPKLNVEDGISAVRAILPQCWIDKTKCAQFLEALRHYRYNVNARTEAFSREPLHDQYSHFADVLRYFSVNSNRIQTKVYSPIEKRRLRNLTSISGY
jgi:phage terminase large subunit